MRDSRITARELAGAALALALLATVFLWEPISRFGSATFTTADLLQTLPLFQLEPGYLPRNQLLSDPVVEFAPWLEFSRRELAAGRFPLWNPDNGTGVPFFANYQSAVLSPFSALFYAFELDTALLASAFLKCWLTGLFTFAFLRRLALTPVAACFGAAAFTYCGHNSLLLAYPHTAVVTFLPASLFIVESILAGAGLAPRRWFALLALTLVVQAYCGHPETLFFCWALLAAYALARLISIARDRGARRAATLGVRLLAVGVGAALIAAPQIVPFLEYVELSTHLQNASSTVLPLDSSTWPRYLFPNLLGTVIDGASFAQLLPPPNYESANLGYAGGLVLVLAILELRHSFQRSSTRLFAAIATLWALWAHDVLGIATLVHEVPWLGVVPAYVSQAPWELSLAVLAAFAVERAFVEAPCSLPRALIAPALAVGFNALFGIGARGVIAEYAERYSPDEAIVDAAHSHVAWMSLTLLAGSACFALARSTATRRVRAIAAAGVGACFLLQNPLLLSEYQVACENRLVRPVTPSLELLARETRGARCVFASKSGLPPQVNLLYGVQVVTNYDALGLSDYDRALGALLRAEGAWQQSERVTPRALELLGAEYVAIDDPGVDSGPLDAAGESRAHWEGPKEDLVFVGQLAGMRLYRYSPSRGRFWLVPTAHEEQDVRSAFALAVARRFDPYEAIVVGRDLPAGFERRGAPSPPPLRDRPARGATAAVGHVEITSEVPGEVHLRVEQPAAQYLSIAQAFYPGWRATIDGREAPLVRANGVFTALDVPAGIHEIMLEYRPRSLQLGMWLALAGLALLAIATVSHRSPSTHD